MRRYQWTLLKALEFLNSRRPDLEIRANFIHQLTDYESRLAAQGIGSKTSKWTEISEKTNEFENEELLLRNTYLNAQMGPFADFSNLPAYSRPCKLRWADERPALPLFTLIEEREAAAEAASLARENSVSQGSVCAAPVYDQEYPKENRDVIEFEEKDVKGNISDIVPAIDPEALMVSGGGERLQEENFTDSNRMQNASEVPKSTNKAMSCELNENGYPDSGDRALVLGEKHSEKVSKDVTLDGVSIRVQAKEVEENLNIKNQQKKSNVDSEKHAAAKAFSKDTENLPRKPSLEREAVHKALEATNKRAESQQLTSKRSAKPSTENTITERHMKNLCGENEMQKTSKEDTIKKVNTGKLLAEKINSLVNPKNVRKHTTLRQRPSNSNSKLSASANLNLTHDRRKDTSPLPLRTHKNPAASRGSKGTPNPQRPETAKKVPAKKVNASARPSSAYVKRDSSVARR
eukprot:TRINITY_DN5324_c0_g3_i1.p1 TRINITY_DN5324_c0_g3~~TRINITY_DN5324_c0_g3_i1.p1  ORF type:complete len:463 (-),score=115.33 TRINITY_DN5324_c0_g3_i1:892-2280(-)